MVLNSHTPYDDPSEDEWELLTGDDSPTDLQLAEQTTPTVAEVAAVADANVTGMDSTEEVEDKLQESADNEPLIKEQCVSESESEANNLDRANDSIAAEESEQPLEEEISFIADETKIDDDHDDNVGGDSTPSPPTDLFNTIPPNMEQSNTTQQNQTQNNQNDNPLQNTWRFIGNAIQDMDNQHQLRHRTRNSVNHINKSVQNIFSNITDETQRVRDQADVHARNASTHVCHAATSAKESICRANEQYKLSEKVATVAVLGGATLLALGNPRAGVTALAVAGASLAAGEIATANQEAAARRRTEYELRQAVHLD